MPAIALSPALRAWVRQASRGGNTWRDRAALRRALTRDLIAEATDLDDPRLNETIERLHYSPYDSFEPRPDRPEEGDEQTGFYESDKLVTFALGGNGSGKTFVAAQRLIAYLCERQPPPIRDTPFWILGPDLELTCKVAWAQKLSTMIPHAWVDWDRITWHHEKQNYPRAVPLIPWEDYPGRNWVLEFKSYEQGRSAMQGTAIGGAWFTEQYPATIFEEVLRGLREWSFPGSVWCEFTPIDPALSVEVEEIYNKWQAGDEQYANYGFHHLNTIEAMKAGHVREDWVKTYFAGVSEDMQETRKRGVFASYTGQIYKNWRPRLHTWNDAEYGPLPIPTSGVIHKRAMDWGSSEEHPFVCLWGFKDATGCWYIYDEYWSNDQSVLWEEHAEIVRERHEWPDDPHYRDCYGDPSRPDLIREFGNAGIPMTAARNDVDEGIERVRLLLRVNEATGDPRLIIDRKACPKLARQMATYRWEKGALSGLNPKAGKPKPLKKDDDAVDALRYLVFSDYVYALGHIVGETIVSPVPTSVRYKRLRR